MATRPMQCIALLAVLFTMIARANATMLSGAVISAPHPSDPDWEVMDTSPATAAWNLWVSVGGSPINGPSDAQAAISVPLSLGTYTFDVFGQPTLLLPTWRLNLYFDGDTTTPGISAFADLDASTTDVPPFFVNTSLDSIGLHDNVIAPAGTLTYVSGDLIVTLSEFVWSTPTINNTDLVGSYTRPPADGPDFVGHFTLTVTPEPGTFGLFFVGIMSLSLRYTPMKRGRN